jgi:hypothetical protein
MWMAALMERGVGELPVEIGKLPAYAPAFKEVYRFILEAMDGDIFAATELFQKYLAGDLPEELLSISRRWVKAEQAALSTERPSPATRRERRISAGCDTSTMAA